MRHGGNELTALGGSLDQLRGAALEIGLLLAEQAQGRPGEEGRHADDEYDVGDRFAALRQQPASSQAKGMVR